VTRERVLEQAPRTPPSPAPGLSAATRPLQSALPRGGRLQPVDVLSLQRAIGNTAVDRVMRAPEEV